MSSNRTFRNLGALQHTASTSRVLNLSALADSHADDPERVTHPFFVNRLLGLSVLLKHRLRLNERSAFDDARPVATKIILPFERKDLKLGGRSVFVGQRGWTEILRAAIGDHKGFERDLDLLMAIDELPSLDPFLLREHLKRRNHTIAHSYFAISSSDLASMQGFVAQEIRKLIDLAYATNKAGDGHVARLVEALLSSENDERLEPLRITLRLEGDSYREGVFSWKGFLYYKWMLSSIWPGLQDVVDELPRLKTQGRPDFELSNYLETARIRLQVAIGVQKNQVMDTLAVYDTAFRNLTHHSDPIAFRNFLLKAPSMFLTLGERIGILAHIASFWRYRFPRDQPLCLPLSEAADILQEFETGLPNVDGLNDAPSSSSLPRLSSVSI